MIKLKSVALVFAIVSAQSVFAGGILTNTNQNIAFNRHFSRDGAIGIDGVYSNPAGVAFMSEGSHISLNWQIVSQTRTVRNEYPLFANNANNTDTYRKYKGNAFAPVVPSVQYAYNKGKFSFQANLAVNGGGGKCEFDNGLGSFERIVSETAYAASNIASLLDGVAFSGARMFSSDAMLGTSGTYTFDSYMRGNQYFYGLTLGAAYKVRPNLSVYVGVRGMYATASYYGYVRNITVGNLPLYQLLDASRTDAADIELSCDQTGVGFAPIIGIDYKVGRWNFAAKYEFKTRLRLKNKSVNKIPSIGNLASTISSTLVQAGMTTEQATAVLSNATISGAMTSLKTTFDSEIDEAIGEYEDGKKIASDIPALLTLGVQYSPVDRLRLNVGGHYFYDLQATSYKHREDLLDRGTIEVNAGVEYDATKRLTVSAGWQNTSYGLTDEYMDDKSYVVSSNSVGGGVCIHLSEKMALNVAYFTTLYKHKKAETEAAGGTYKADYTRTNHVWGVGLNIDI